MYEFIQDFCFQHLKLYKVILHSCILRLLIHVVFRNVSVTILLTSLCATVLSIEELSPIENCKHLLFLKSLKLTFFISKDWRKAKSLRRQQISVKSRRTFISSKLHTQVRYHTNLTSLRCASENSFPHVSCLSLGQTKQLEDKMVQKLAEDMEMVE